MIKNIGILVHGRHLTTKNWTKIVWGNPAASRLGTLPTLILTILTKGPTNIKTIVFGSGSSEEAGVKESQVMKEYLRKHFDTLRIFDQIRNHPAFNSKNEMLLRKLVDSIICETISQNTKEEILAAANIFANEGVKEVIQITCSSHAPRCIKEAAIVRENSLTTEGQLWSVVQSMTTFSGTKVSDVVIFEPPHRGDDPMINAEIYPHDVFSLFFKVKDVKKKVKLLHQIQKLIKSEI